MDNVSFKISWVQDGDNYAIEFKNHFPQRGDLIIKAMEAAAQGAYLVIKDSPEASDVKLVRDVCYVTSQLLHDQ